MFHLWRFLENEIHLQLVLLNESLFIPPASSLSCSSSAFQYSSVTTETREYITCHQIHVWLYPDPERLWKTESFKCSLYFIQKKGMEWLFLIYCYLNSKRSSRTFLIFSFIRSQCVFISVSCVCCCFFLTCPINCMFPGSLQL